MDELMHCYRHPGRETRVTCSECGRPICPDCMTFAPVGIRCPDHRATGRLEGDTRRQVNVGRNRLVRHPAPATLILIAVNVLVYLITVFQGEGLNKPGGDLFSDWWLTGVQVAAGDWWRVGTVMFLHGSLIHLMLNMFVLWVLGSVVEQVLGTWRYLLVYVVSGLAGSAGALLMTKPTTVTVGASGAIFGLMGALLVIEWMNTGSLAGEAAALIVINLAITFAVPGISIGGHLGGLVGGVASTYLLLEAHRRRLPAIAGPAAAVAVAVVAVVVSFSQAG